jgi:hypothetical protein
MCPERPDRADGHQDLRLLRHSLALPTIPRVTAEEQPDLVSDLLEPIPRTAVVPAVRAALGLSEKQADRIVQAFDDFVAKPLAANLAKLRGRDLRERDEHAEPLSWDKLRTKLGSAQVATGRGREHLRHGSRGPTA